MTYELEYLLRLVGCGARGQLADPPLQKIDWDKLLETAAGLKMKPFVSYAIKRSENLGCPEHLKKAAREEVIQQSLKYHYGCAVLSKLQSDLEKEGIPSAILKGYAVSRAYAVPELRMGCDVDLYVDIKNEKKALAWFEKHQWRITARRHRRDTHDLLYKESAGILELHVCLCGKNNPIYMRVSEYEKDIRTPVEAFLTLETTEGNMKTLGCNDHAIFLCTHMAKHLITEQISNPRQLLDIAVFLDCYSSEIDKAYFWRTMEFLGYQTLVVAILRIAEQYFGYEYNDFTPLDVSIEQMDLLENMYFKTTTAVQKETGRVAHEYNLAAFNKKQRFRYKLGVLIDYTMAVGGKIKREGFFEMMKTSIVRFNGIMFHKYKEEVHISSDTPSAAEERLKFLRNMDMM